MKTTLPSDRNAQEDTSNLPSGWLARPDQGGHRWRFRIAFGVFVLWLAYLGWIVWKVIGQ